MDLPNLATVICPSIIYSRSRDAVRDESFGGIRVVTSLLENQDEFYTVPEEFLLILHDQEYFSNTLELPSKEFLKKCDTYMRFKAGGRTPASAVFPSSPNPANPPRSIPAPERPTLISATSESQLRNGRQQSPHSQPGYAHVPMSYPSPVHPTSLSQGAVMIQSQQPRHPQSQDTNWVAPQRSSTNPSTPSPGTRPSSYVPPRASGELTQGLPPNGYQATMVRQRT